MRLPVTGIILLVSAFSASYAQSGTASTTPTSSELKQLFDADQADRRAPLNADISHWEKVSQRDHERRERVLTLVKSGALESADDYYHAAMVLQHGDGSEDILLSHILSTVAGFKGHKSAQWLAAASLDRFLHRSNQPQRLGTQYVRRSDSEPWSQGAYESWLPDKIRAEFGVPPLAKQIERVTTMNKPEPTKPPIR